MLSMPHSRYGGSLTKEVNACAHTPALINACTKELGLRFVVAGRVDQKGSGNFLTLQDAQVLYGGLIICMC